MKTMLCIAVCCIMSLALAQAQSPTIRNNTTCDMVVTPFCFTNPGCVATVCGSPVNVPAGSMTVPVPVCNPACQTGTIQGYRVCWYNLGCTSVCVDIGTDPSVPCTMYPTSAILPGCPGSCCNRTSGFNVAYAIGTMDIVIF